jgi:hypothetical protein
VASLQARAPQADPLDRIALAPAAGALLSYSAFAAFGALRLPHVGAWTLQIGAAILVAAALALFFRQLWSLIFALLFYTLSALGYGALAVVLGRDALAGSSGGEWAGVRGLLLGGIAAVVLCAAAVSAALASTLVPAWRQVTRSRSAAAWVLSTALALASLVLVAWLVGDRCWKARLIEQNECFSGNGPRCDELARDARFTAAERHAFALRGCVAGSESACLGVAATLQPAHRAESPEASALDASCRAGNPDLCRRLGVHLLKLGDAAGGTRHLERSCALDTRFCDSAARAAEEQGAWPLARRLREQGCEREDARACRGLLQQMRASLQPGELEKLELRACLVGDVNDCRPLMRRDLEGVCRQICAGASESLMHSCGFCAREAAAAGASELAEAWLAGSCARGYRWSCRDLEQLQRARISAGPAQVSRRP